MGRKVEYCSRSQSSKFIEPVIEFNEFYPRKYLTKSPLGDYYSFPAIDDEDRLVIYADAAYYVDLILIAMDITSLIK
ncbi:hypothetical protein TNIN_499271 [Trichonephila inaurata madagascariensis]|uniref:Uncharacterized protein n=1 Tax=Trichonephila inaurata madagascariensis TaxID=2747483 RepID=A0A8X6YUK4_9ARAC|nr:hypothetical protein TNIN_499271 [Trichonephila inaurata madagascariensis]